ncbi:MAG: RNA 2',3'-cyclic phosphodiesterase [Candidatus Omnitrophica bacterium]|nr:RNA 2',3'-cyclic phosphodiesterase [Candidatus Omnitrophota bacterium]MCM8799325.1 RNA 2',3'-cyclic phosphodiesterase [Candidatus Omnitrophota bacterium]
MRTFIAVELPSEIKEYLSYLQVDLKSCNADVKWVEPKNIHITLKFLGEVKEEKITSIKKIMEKISNQINSFAVSIFSLNGFPNIESPRVIWVEIKNGQKELLYLNKLLEEELSSIGIPKEKRPFCSHITLGRVRSHFNYHILKQKIIESLDKPIQENKEFIVKYITLFKSTLTSSGPIYEAIYKVSLKEN